MKLLATPAVIAFALVACGLAEPASAQSGGRAAAPASPQTFAPAPSLAPAQSFAPATVPSTFGAVGQPVASTACSPCSQPVAQPTFALSPVAVQQPVVLQSVPSRPRLFSGRLLRWIFGSRDVVAAPVAVAPIATPAPTFAARPILGTPALVTTAYQPTYPLTAAVAVPTFQSVARPVALAPTAFRPVTLSAPGCSVCSSGVTTAGFNAPACPSCAAAPATTFSQPAQSFAQPVQPFTGSAGPTPAAGGQETPQPGLSPGAAVPDQRLRPLPGGAGGSAGSATKTFSPGTTGPETTSPAPVGGSDTKNTFDVGSDADAFWQPPKLFAPNTRTTSRPVSPTAPAWHAVYNDHGVRSSVRQTVHQVGPDQPAPRKVQWRSTRD